MLELKNGVLHKDGKPVIALGQSYYPSFHEAKYPVPPNGDRLGIMREDIRMMREAGFGFLRIAALGEVWLEEDQVKVDTGFVDEVLKEAHEKGMATSVRLQGYVMNIRGNKDYMMRNSEDEPMEQYWSAFIHNSLFHKGILRDNRDVSQALAKHFDTIPGVISYQIYNEPHYPYNGIFDYHPATLEAYRKWREEKGLEPEEAPRRRPVPGESPESWIQWRLFSTQAMGNFLNQTAAAVKEVAPHKETYTCVTSSPATSGVASQGISYFDMVKDMDAMGITSYTHLEGYDYYTACYQYDMAECAAAVSGKHAWTIEIDARTHIPARKVHEETYSLLAAGHKGIVYYEWRGDYPDEGTPLPDNCGFIYSDGSKTAHFDRSVEMVQFVNRYSTLFAAAEKMRDGVAVLCSDHAAAYADAYRNDLDINIYAQQSVNIYRELRKAGMTVDLVCAEHLTDNKLETKLLLIPTPRTWLSEEECTLIDRFVAKGGNAFYLKQETTFAGASPYGFWQWDVEIGNQTTLEFRSALETEDVLERCGIEPRVKCSSRHLKAGVLKGDSYALIILTNTDPGHADVKGAVLQTSLPFHSAKWISPDVELTLEGDGNQLKLPEICEGGVVVLELIS